MSRGIEHRPGVLLGFFLLLHVLNQVDRNLIASFGPDIVADLKLSHMQFGIVTGIAFTAVYAVLALGAGVLADRFGRARIMAGGLTVWSAFTALSALARSFAALVALRPFVAAGEATLIPTATAILSSTFSEKRRALAIGIFFVGVPLGIGLSFLIANWLGPVLGWRAVFALLGCIGILLVPIVLRISRPSAAEPALQHGPAPNAASILRDLWQEFKANPDFRLCLMASVLMHVYLAGGPFLKLWLAESGASRAKEIALFYGLVVIMFGIIGAIAGGALADRFRAVVPGGRATLLAAFIAVLAPLILSFRFAAPGSPLFYCGMVAGVLFFSAFYGPAFAILQSVTPPRLHASATGLSMLFVNVIALGLGSVAIGAASDALAARGASAPLTLPLIAADSLSLLSLACFARIGWRAARSGKKT